MLFDVYVRTFKSLELAIQMRWCKIGIWLYLKRLQIKCIVKFQKAGKKRASENIYIYFVMLVLRRFCTWYLITLWHLHASILPITCSLKHSCPVRFGARTSWLYIVIGFVINKYEPFTRDNPGQLKSLHYSFLISSRKQYALAVTHQQITSCGEYPPSHNGCFNAKSKADLQLQPGKVPTSRNMSVFLNLTFNMFICCYLYVMMSWCLVRIVHIPKNVGFLWSVLTKLKGELHVKYHFIPENVQYHLKPSIPDNVVFIWSVLTKT